MNVLTKTTIAGLECFHGKGLDCVCSCVCACVHAVVQTQLQLCVAQTTTPGRWAEYEFTSHETSTAVELQKLLLIVSLLDTCEDLKADFNISYPQTVLKVAMKGEKKLSGKKNRIH